MVRLVHSVRGSQSETDDKPFPFKAFAKARMVQAKNSGFDIGRAHKKKGPYMMRTLRCIRPRITD
jgi:hypothetical protein